MGMRVGWLIGWGLVGLLLAGCGGSDLLFPGALPTAAPTSTPGSGCSTAGGGCDNVNTFCCSGTLACNGVTCDF